MWGIDSINGAVINNRPIHEDLGDIVPFLLYYGEVELARSQVKAAWDSLEAVEWLFQSSRSRYRWALDAYDWSDLLWGLMAWAEYTGDDEDRRRIDALFDKWWELFVFAGNRPTGICLHKFSVPLPVAILRSISMYPEILVRWYSFSGQPKYLTWAKYAGERWIADSFFQKHGLFPRASLTVALGIRFGALAETIFSPIFPRLRHVRLFKDNTNFFASLLALYRETKEPDIASAILHWVQSVSKRIIRNDGSVRMEWYQYQADIGKSSLLSFQLIDLLCDAYHAINDACLLYLATRVADFWIEHVGFTGLFPARVSIKREEHAPTAVDNETDMVVALLKLAESSADSRYYDIALQCANGMIKYHYQDYGLANSVDANTGSVFNTLCKTKFYVLSLKIWIALENYGRLNTDAMRDLLADR